MKTTKKTLSSLTLSTLFVFALIFSSCDLINLGGNTLGKLKTCTRFEIYFDVDILNSEGQQVGWGTSNTLPIVWDGNSFSGLSDQGMASYEVSGTVSDNGKTILTLTIEEYSVGTSIDQSFERKANFEFQNIPYSSSYTQTGDYAFGYTDESKIKDYVKSYSVSDGYLNFTHKAGYGESASIDYLDSDIEINFYNEEYEFFDDL